MHLLLHTAEIMVYHGNITLSLWVNCYNLNYVLFNLHLSIILLYRKSKAYKKEYGNCNVSQQYETNKSLGHWVNKQRKAYNNGTLTKERVKLLEGLGFEWQVEGKTDRWIKRGIELSSAEVDELQNAKGIQRIRAIFQSKFSGFEARDSIMYGIRNGILTVRNSCIQSPFS